MKKVLSRVLIVCGFLPVLSALSAPASAAWDPNPTIPRISVPYYCTWKFVSGDKNGQHGDIRLAYEQLNCQKLSDGNTLCHGLMKYPDGGVPEEKVTLAKPVSCGAQCSTWEYTVNQPYQAQCKAYRAWEVLERDPAGIAVKRYHLQFRQCDNGAEQDCEFPPR